MATIYDYNKIIKIVHLNRSRKLLTFSKGFIYVMLERTGKISEAATLGVLWKRLFLRFSQNSQEDTCVRASFLLKLQASGLPVTSLKRRLWHSCFPMKFVKIWGTLILNNICERLLLEIEKNTETVN